METTSKQRNQSQCREWERQRRNKFNDAINKLGEIVKAISKSNETSSNETDRGKVGENVKYPKIEIVQKAIIYLNNSAQEKTQLKADILALQIKLESIKEVKTNRKDASTQVHLEITKKNKSKYAKLKTNKSKRTDTKKKDLPLKPILLSEDGNTRLVKKTKENAITPKLPTLLPRCNVFDKKGQENTFVVLPAAPYIFPQRPILLPSMPPTIVVVDSSLQAINKSVPIVSRNGGDITKTTMVNILPISAYSRPLSANRQKKSNVRVKPETNKKTIKKTKPTIKKIQEIEGEKPNSQPDEAITKRSDAKVSIAEIIENKKEDAKVTANNSESSVPSHVALEKETTNEDSASNKNEANHTLLLNSKTSEAPKTTEVSKIIESVKTAKCDVNKNDPAPITPVQYSTTTVINATEVKCNSKKEDYKPSNKLEKEVVREDKDRENKLPSILDTTLCDNVVDGGNARLELAEEFLAASPTAAFLMSFPLVSGNRADSPADEQNTASSNSKDIAQKRSDSLLLQPSTSATYFEKTSNDIKIKTTKAVIPNVANKQNEQAKYISNTIKVTDSKPATTSSMSFTSNENPFLNIPMPSFISTTCALSDTSFGLDFESNIAKSAPSQPTTNSNIFYKNDPFSTAKSTIYSTSSISSNHDFNGIGLYPCAMEKYAPKMKSDFTNIDDTNVMKLGPSRLTYDIDLGWSHKGFDFVSCSANSTYGKDNSLTTVTSSTPFCTSYNPFNPEFHVPLVSTSNKRDGANKTTSSFADTISSLYTQATNFWPEEPYYNNSSVSKNLSSKHQNYPLPLENIHGVSNLKANNPKQYEAKDNPESNVDSRIKNNTVAQQINERYTKKSPSKMHINWMTSEIRPMQSAYNPMHTEIKEPHKITYNHLDHTTKRNDYNDANNYFPISMHNFPAQPVQEEFQVWPSTRPLGTTEISIDPPPINLPTLVGDLALGPHDKKKNVDTTSRTIPQEDPLQNCSNFFSVTQLMNRTSDNASSRYQPSQVDSAKTNAAKHNLSHYSNDSNRKAMSSRIENHASQPYISNNSKITHSYENMAQFSQKPKATNKLEKSAKAQKNNYSAEALLRGGSCSQKIQDNNSSKFMMAPQKYNDFNVPQDSSVAQVSHFPPLIDYSENSYTGQQFPGTSLYNTTTNTLSNSFYTNFMPGSSNLMPSNYTSGPFPSEFIDYNQSTECNFPTHKYEELKMRNNTSMFQVDKTSNYKSSRRESAAKHKLECSKKESSKKYQSKRSKLNSDVEEWSEPSHLLWQNKPHSKRHPNLITEELPFPNYVSNQMHSQYQPDVFNSHLMSSNMQTVGPNVDKTLSSFPITSRANFNLSTIFPEITMKVQ